MARGEAERAAATKAEKYKEIRNRYSILPKDKDGHDFDDVQKLSNSEWLKAQYEKDPEHLAESILSAMEDAEERIKADIAEKERQALENSQEIAEFIENRLTYYKSQEYQDGELWEAFREDFEGWTKDTFFTARDKDLVKRLRGFLRRYGVWVSKDGDRIGANLQKVIEESSYHEWTKAEIADQFKHGGRLYSYCNPPISQSTDSQSQAIAALQDQLLDR